MRRTFLFLAALACAGAASAQVNNPGVFKSGSSVGNDIAQWTGTGTAIAGQGKTITTSQPAAIRQTWNAGAVTFTGFKVSITATASAALSLIMDLQVGGSTKFAVGKDGLMYGTPGVSSGLFGQRASNIFSVYNSTSAFPQLDIAASGLLVGSGGSIAFNSATETSSGAADAIWVRDAANVIGQRNGTNSQQYNVYRTSSAANANYERLAVYWSGSGFRLETQNAGTGSPRDLELFTTSSAAMISFTTNNVGRMYVGGSGGLTIGNNAPLTTTHGSLGIAKITASGTAPGAAGVKMEVVCGTNAGTAKLTIIGGTSTSPQTILDNIGAGVTGC